MNRTVLAILTLCVASSAAAGGQVTASEFVGAARSAALTVVLDDSASAELEANLSVIEESAAARLEEESSALGSPGLMTLSRRNQNQYDFELPTADEDPEVSRAVDGARQTLSHYGVYGRLVSAVGEDAANQMWEPITRMTADSLRDALDRDLAKMRRFEKKFGPRAPRLNALEVGLNFVLQRLPGFRPTEENGPGRLEVIAAYDAAYLTVVDDEPELISTAGFGLRCYMFGDGWGERDGLAGVLRPAYLALGMLVAPDADGALLWPWQGDSRLGAFVTWGELKLAYVGGDEQRFMVSREFEAIPWLF